MRVSCIITSLRKYLRGNTSEQHSSELQYQSLHSLALRLPNSSTSFFHGPPQTLKHSRSPITHTSVLNELSLLKSYLEIPTERHMWNWEWFSDSTGSHLHTLTTSHPHLKPALEPLCSLFPADQWDPDKTPATKETRFLGNFSQLVEEKNQRETIYSWFVLRTERRF